MVTRRDGGMMAGELGKAAVAETDLRREILERDRSGAVMNEDDDEVVVVVEVEAESGPAGLWGERGERTRERGDGVGPRRGDEAGDEDELAVPGVRSSEIERRGTRGAREPSRHAEGSKASSSLPELGRLRLSVAFQRFLMVFCARPGRKVAMTAHLLPYSSCFWIRMRSSSGVKGPLRSSGARWLCQRSLHCLPTRPFIWLAILVQWRAPCSATSLRRSSSSCIIEKPASDR